MRWSTLGPWLCSISVLFGVGCGEQEEPEAEPIVLKGTLSDTGSKSAASTRLSRGAELAVKWVNEVHGGVDVAGTRRRFVFEHTDDTSDTTLIKDKYRELCADSKADFLMAPYSSANTAAAVKPDGMNECGKVMVNWSGSATVTGLKNVVQTATPAARYFLAFAKLLADAARAGNRTGKYRMGVLNASGPAPTEFKDGVLKYISETAEISSQIDVVYQASYPEASVSMSTTVDALNAAVTGLVATDPPVDIVIVSGQEEDGIWLNKRFAELKFAPKAMSVAVAPSAENYYTLICPTCKVGPDHPANFVSVPVQWALEGGAFSKESAASAGVGWMGPTQAEFIASHKEKFGGDVELNYHTAFGASGILILAKAIETAGSTEPSAVRSALASMRMQTFFGGYAVDANGNQTGHDMIIQEWLDGQLKTVGPAEVATTKFSLRE